MFSGVDGEVAWAALWAASSGHHYAVRSINLVLGLSTTVLCMCSPRALFPRFPLSFTAGALPSGVTHPYAQNSVIRPS